MVHKSKVNSHSKDNVCLLRSSGSKNDSSESVLKLQKVDVGGHGLQLLVGGQVSPAAIFEGGFGTGIASWSTVQKDVLLLLKRSHMIVLVSVSLIWDRSLVPQNR